MKEDCRKQRNEHKTDRVRKKMARNEMNENAAKQIKEKHTKNSKRLRDVARQRKKHEKEILRNFITSRNNGPTYVCTCCLWYLYRRRAIQVKREKYRKGKIPSQAQANEMSLSNVPDELKQLFQLKNAASETEPAHKPDLSTAETDDDANNQSSLGQNEEIDSEDKVENENSADFITDMQNSRAINSDTCIQPVSGPEVKTNEIFNLAPGEGKTPVSITKEPQSEALSFPKLFPTATNTYYQVTPRPSPITAKQYVT
ncbi:hypothetical protein MAR_021404 [Mya arenaria]|uniref:Uncharacterized protein n=1 Tax=Mya arenaria TaxID=6604 RepID=A0ABY7E7L8_MYAAR|nr:hypothetical protein MAR_021404 [Mya arenaria]